MDASNDRLSDAAPPPRREGGDPFIAVDWGTTNRRAYLIEGGTVRDAMRDARGVTTVATGDYPAEIAAIRVRFDDHPILLAGMVGSTAGWRVAPYVAAPAGLDELAAAICPVADRVAIVPGVSVVADGRGDVMRGEEVQLLGAAAAGLAPADALLCQPGTHSKWATLRGGRLVGFTTALTGELFALLRRHSLLAHQLGGDAHGGDAFDAGVRDGADGDLLARLFGIRAAGLLELRGDDDAASYLSGLLIGADAGARLAAQPGATVHVLADPVLGGLYARAIDALGGVAIAVDGEAAFVAGITAIRDRTG